MWTAFQVPHIRHHRRRVVILDNASIHKSRRLKRMIRRAGGEVLFTPPYGWDCTPLDHGAFGIVKRRLQREGARIAQGSMRRGLDRALSRIGPSAAAYCFANCGYEDMLP